MLAKVALGVVCFFGVILSVLFFFYAAGPWIEHRAIPIFGVRIYDSVLFGVAGLFCAFVNLRLIQGRTWAWWTAFAASLLALALGAFILIAALSPRNDFARSESGFGLGISVLLIVPATLNAVLLNLPPVRRRFP